MRTPTVTREVVPGGSSARAGGAIGLVLLGVVFIVFLFVFSAGDGRSGRWSRVTVVAAFGAPPRESAKDTAVEEGTCLDCHEKLDESLAGTAHRLSSQTKNPAAIVRCTSCHEGAEGHLEDPSRETMVALSELDGYAVRKLCTRCHKAHDALDDYGYDAHSAAEIGCTACHKVHAYEASLLLDQGAEFCFECHAATRNEFRARSSHPVLQRNVTCLSCHRFVKRRDHAKLYDLARMCRDCHPEQGGPFLFEHPAVNAYAASGAEGCTDCHRPHGSENDRLLRLPPERICAQCHFPVLHKTAHGGAFADSPCGLCHVDTHGSFRSSLFLAPDMLARTGAGAGFDCYQSGCHTLVK